MNIKNLRYYSKIFVLTLATSITLSGCQSIENKESINFKQVGNQKAKNTKEELEFSYDQLTSLKVEYDENKEQYLLSGEITSGEIEGTEKDLSDIFGLVENAANLESITIDSNHLEDIELLNYISNKEKIKRIAVYSNYAFENINFLNDFKNVESLFLSINSTDYSAINNVKKLKSLGLFECIGDDFFLPALDLEELQTLYIFPEKEKEYNTTFVNSIQNSKQLETFAARKVIFENIDFLEDKTNLSYLDLGNCNISDISVIANLTNLEYVYLDNNRIMDATPLYNLPNLKYVQLNSNYLSEDAINQLIEKGICTKETIDITLESQIKPLIKDKKWKYGN